MANETIELSGHIVDSLLLAKVLDTIVEAGVTYDLADVQIGRTNTDTSTARIELEGDQAELDRLIDDLQVHGANRVTSGTTNLVAADRDGVLPVGFYSTTNLATDVLLDDEWVAVENPEMDCGIVVTARGARTIPMHRVMVGDQIVVGSGGVRVHAPAKQRGASAFEFMNSEVSSEKPKALVVQQVAERIRAAHAAGDKVLAVCGPAVVHTGGAPDVARLIEAGWIDVLFAGNGFATHDIESNVLGTSLGVLLAEGTLTEGGHSNHLQGDQRGAAPRLDRGGRRGRVRHRWRDGHVRPARRSPSCSGARSATTGRFPTCTSNTAEAADAMRELIPGVSVALMLASTLHAIAVGNCLPAGVETFCVDINQAVVTKLADRGSHQAHGIVTDVGPFLGQLADVLC